MAYKFNPFTKKFDYYEAGFSGYWDDLSGKPSSSPAEIDDAVAKRHNQNTDTGTDSPTFEVTDIVVTGNYTDGNPISEISHTNLKLSVDRMHDQDTDTYLDDGGPNEVSAAEIRSHIDDTNNPHGTTAEQVPTNQTGETVQDSLDSKEILANKSTATDLGGVSPSNTLYPSQAAVKAYADQLIGAANAVVYKGAIDASSNPNYPAADAGDLYVISVAGKIGGASGVDVESGDVILCNTDGTISGNQATVGAYWHVIEKNQVGLVYGPTSAVDNDLSAFDGVTGKLIKDSGLSTANTSDAISKRHTQNTDTILTTNGSTALINAGTLKENLSVDALKTIDGRDVSVDGTKLDGIESGATADQIASEVPFTPNGDIASTNVQAAIQEVRDDTDTKLSFKVTGPASAVDSNIAEYDTTTGKLIKDGGLTHANLANTSGTNTGDETTTTLGNTINSATEKTTPVDADMVGLMDSAASNILKKLSWATIKATTNILYWDNYSKLMLHGEGANNSTTIIDQTGKIGTAGGNAKIDRSQFKFGFASIKFDGVGDFVSFPNSSDWNFGTGDFTIEAQIRFNNVSNTQTFFGQNTDANNEWRFLWNNTNMLQFIATSAGSDIISISNSWTPSINVWYHIMLVRTGNDFKMFIDGIQIGTTQTDTSAVGNFTGLLYLGIRGDGTNQPFDGWMDEVQISKDVARYTSNFPSPTNIYFVS